MIAPLLIALGVSAAFTAAWGRTRSRSIVRRTHERLPLGQDGIILGAEPVSLEGRPGQPGVLLLHGFGDTPQTLRYLADHLHALGYTVHAPLLPGHGRTLDDFERSTAADWELGARSALRDIRERHDTVYVVGLSMGGAIATLLAAEEPPPPALVLLAPYLGSPPKVRWLARTHLLGGFCMPWMGGRAAPRSILDESERDRSLSYRAFTLRLLGELVALSDRAWAALPSVTTPTLILQSRADNRIAAHIAEDAMARLGSRDVRLEWVERCGHIITVDYGRERVFEQVAEWIASHPAATIDAGMTASPSPARRM